VLSAFSSALTQRWVPVALLFVSASAFGPALRAETVEIEFSAFALHYGTYNGNQDFFDSTSASGGNGVLSEATQMGTVTIFVDGVSNHVYSPGQIDGDLLVTNVGNLTSTSATLFNGNAPNEIFGFDLLTASGPLLNLNFLNSGISGFYAASNSGTPYILAMGGPIATIPFQNLPLGGLELAADTVSISFSGTNFSKVVTSGGLVTSFDVNVTGTITGTLVPEPSTLTFLGIGAISLLAYGWRRCRS
jgi:hypothetical protein